MNRSKLLVYSERDIDLARALLSSDLDEVKRIYEQNMGIETYVCNALYLATTDKHKLKYSVEILFEPSDEMINFLISINRRCVVSNLIDIFISNYDTGRLLYLAEHTAKYISGSILTIVINKYVHDYENAKTRNMLLALINYMEDKLTLFDIFLLTPVTYSRISNNVYSYIIFKVINDNILQSTDTNTINDLLKIAIIGNAPRTLIDLLYKYASPVNNHDHYEFNVKSRAFGDPDYASLFYDDI